MNSNNSIIDMFDLKENFPILNQTNKQDSYIISRPWDFGEISLLILLIFGTVGNVLSIIVMNSKRMRHSTATLFLTAIALSDIAFLSMKFLSNMVKLYQIPIFSWYGIFN